MKVSVSFLSDFIIFIFLILIALVTTDSHFTIKIFGWLNIILFLYYILKTKKTHNLLSFYFILLSMMYLFNFGQIILYSIGLGESINQSLVSANVIEDRSLSTVVLSIKFSTLVIFLFNMAAQTIFRKNIEVLQDKNTPKTNKRSEISQLKLCKITGILTIIISIFFAIQYDLSYFQKALTSGYGSLSSMDINYGITDDMARLFKVGMIFLIIGFKNKKTIALPIMGFNIAYSLLKIIIIGQRGYEIIFILVLVWIFYRMFSKFNAVKFVLIFLATILLLSITSLSVLFRDSTDRFGMESIISFAINSNPLISSINEFGSSLITTQLFIDYVPNTIAYGYGTSYFYSLFTILPNIGGFFSEITQMAYPNAILASHHPGIGGNLIGEFYYNFGNYGILMGYLFGLIIAWLSILVEKSLVINNYYKFAILAIILNIVLWTVRDSFSIVPRNLMFAMIIPLIVVVLTEKNTRRST